METLEATKVVKKQNGTLEQPLRFYGERIVIWKGNPHVRRTAFSGIKSDNNLSISIAECSEKDKFEKKTGREIADQRLKDNEFIITADLSAPKYRNKTTTQVFVYLCSKALKRNGLLDKLHNQRVSEKLNKK